MSEVLLNTVSRFFDHYYQQIIHYRYVWQQKVSDLKDVIDLSTKIVSFWQKTSSLSSTMLLVQPQVRLLTENSNTDLTSSSMETISLVNLGIMMW